MTAATARFQEETFLAREELTARRRDLEQEYALVDGMRQATLAQRRDVAEKLWASRRELQAELDLIRREALLAVSQSELTAAADAASSAELQRLRSEIEELQDRLDAAILERGVLRTRVAELEAAAPVEGAGDVELAELREANARLIAERDELQVALRDVDLSRADTAAQVARVTQLETERDSLRTQAQAAEARARAAETKLTQQAAFGDQPEKIQELHKRYEIAMEDVRGLKRKITELESQLAAVASRAAARRPPSQAGGKT
ncbi:MAG: hypothetical protein QM811_11790 [Pirellulales bacterium]